MADRRANGVPTIRAQVIALMADGQERTIADIALALGGRMTSVARMLRALSREGAVPVLRVVRVEYGKNVYVSAARVNSCLFAIGERRLRKTFIRDDWPVADPVTQQAMHGMVCAGRPHVST